MFRVALLNKEENFGKVQRPVNTISFAFLNSDPAQTFEDKIQIWIDKQLSDKAIGENWKRFTTLKDVKSSKMQGMIIQKQSNSARIITNGSGTAHKNLSIFVVICLFPEVLKIDTKIQDT